MKAECVLEKLKQGIMRVEKVIGRNLTLPVLSSILITTTDSSLILRTTNLNVGVEIDIPAKIKEKGTVAVSGSVLSNIFSTMSSNGSVILESKNDNFFITSEHSSMTVKGVAHDDFPTLPKVSTKNSFSLPTDKFIEGVRAVIYSASPSDIKPEIASVYMYYDNDSIVFVATDSFRLAERKVKVKKVQEFQPILIPVKNMNDILRIFDDSSEELQVSIDENQIFFITDSVYCTSRIVDGTFPDYKQIIPKEFKTEVIALKNDVVQVLKMTNIFSDKFNQVDIIIEPKNKVCTFHSKNADVGESNVMLKAALSGVSISASVNHRYLQECFQSIPKDSVTLQFSDTNKPLVVRGVSDPLFTYLVMPMNR